MPKQFYGRIDLRGNEAFRFTLENRTTYPAGAKVGQLFFHTTEQAIKVFLNSSGTNNSAEPYRWFTLSDDLFDKKGTETYTYNSDGDIESVTTTLPGGLQRVETTTYVNGDPSSILVTIPALGISRTETIVKDVDDNITGTTIS